MSQAHFGDLSRRYKFLLNPHADIRLSRCPLCDKLTFPRKFAFFIHVDGWGPLVLGKTCKYCSRSELIICHQDELDEILTHTFERLKPGLIGNKYLVLGTVTIKAWKTSISGSPMTIDEVIRNTADFKAHESLDYNPGGWRPADADLSRWTIKHEDAEARRKTSWTLGRQSPSTMTSL